MNFDFSEDQLAIRDAVEALCADFGADYWLERDRDGRWPSEFCDAVARGGWFGVSMPKEHGRRWPRDLAARLRGSSLRRRLG